MTKLRHSQRNVMTLGIQDNTTGPGNLLWVPASRTALVRMTEEKA